MSRCYTRILKPCIPIIIAISSISVLTPVVSMFTANNLGILTQQLANQSLASTVLLIIEVLVGYLLCEILEFCYIKSCGILSSIVYTEMQRQSMKQITGIAIDSEFINNKGDLINRITKNTEDLTLFFSSTLPDILSQALLIVLVIMFLFSKNQYITCIYLLTLLVSILIQAGIGKMIKKSSGQVKQIEAKLSQQVYNILNNKTIVNSNNAYAFADSIYMDSAKQLKKENFRFSMLTSPLKVVGIICGITPLLSICIAGIWMIPSKSVDAATFLSIFYLCRSVMPKQLHYVDLITAAIKVYPAIRRLSDFWNCEKYTSGITNLTEGKDYSIKLTDVWYRYPQSEIWTIKGVSLEIPQGSKVAFCGSSGSGKSTVLKLIAGLISAQAGEIYANHAVISAQFPFLFTDSILANICCFTPDNIDCEFIEQACQLSGIQNFLPKLEQGIHTPILNNGSNLSGGQKQRISVARALCTRSSILLFDEPCSALDMKTAEFLIRNVIEFSPNTTVIMVLHQPELLKYFDEIYEFDGGKIIHHRKNQGIQNV